MAIRNSKRERLAHDRTLNRHPERVRAPHFQIGSFFDPDDLVQVKYEMLRQVTHEGAGKAETAEMYGISRPTFYQAEAAFAQAGLAGLLPRQRGPKGAHKLTAKVMDFIAQCRAADPTLHARELARVIHNELGLSVHPRSIERALARKKKHRPSEPQ